MTSKGKRPPSVDEINAAAATFSIEDSLALIAEVGLPFDGNAHWLDPELKDQWGDLAGPAELTQFLNNMAFDLRYGERVQAIPSETKVVDASAKIAKQAAALLHLILDESGEVKHGLGPEALFAHAAIDVKGSGRAAVQEAVEAIERLRGWAASVAAAPQRRPATRKLGRKKDEAWHLLIARLTMIYELFWGERAALSRDPATGKPSGPLLRFSRTIAAKLRPEKSDEAIASALGELIYAYRENEDDHD